MTPNFEPRGLSPQRSESFVLHPILTKAYLQRVAASTGSVFGPLCPAKRRWGGRGIPAALSERSEFSGRPGRRSGGREAEGRRNGVQESSTWVTNEFRDMRYTLSDR